MSPILRCTVHPSIVKDGAGAGAWAASTALAMHEQGMEGLPSIFAFEPEGRKAIAGLGEDWHFLRQYFKLYPTCRWTHAPVESVMRLRAEHGFSAGDVAGIEVESFAETGTLMTFPPRDSDGAQYCLPWAVAAALVDGELGVAQVLPSRLADPAIVALGRLVSFAPAADLQARFPRECLARVSVTLKDGRRLAGTTTGARGDYTDPASDRELDEKFMRLAEPALGARRARDLGEIVDTLDRRPAAELLELLGEGVG
jgi:2-methylcitrate dehydratase PrpD